MSGTATILKRIEDEGFSWEWTNARIAAAYNALTKTEPRPGRVNWRDMGDVLEPSEFNAIMRALDALAVDDYFFEMAFASLRDLSPDGGLDLNHPKLTTALGGMVDLGKIPAALVAKIETFARVEVPKYEPIGVDDVAKARKYATPNATEKVN